MIISVHTPKAGGTSTLKVLHRAYGENAVHSDIKDDPSDPASAQYCDHENWLAQRPTSFPEHIKVVHGHFRPLKYAAFSQAFWFTFLRHPVDNIISIFNYWSAIPVQPHSLHQKFKQNPVGLIEFAHIEPLRYLYTKTYFGDWDMATFNFIGSHENRAADLLRLGDLLEVSFDPEVYENRTDSGNATEKPTIDSATVETLSDILGEDIDFYQRHALS